MPGYSLNRVGVVMLGVRDLNRAVSFYRDTLGLTLNRMLKNASVGKGGVLTPP